MGAGICGRDNATGGQTIVDLQAPLSQRLPGSNYDYAAAVSHTEMVWATIRLRRKTAPAPPFTSVSAAHAGSVPFYASSRQASALETVCQLQLIRSSSSFSSSHHQYISPSPHLRAVTLSSLATRRAWSVSLPQHSKVAPAGPSRPAQPPPPPPPARAAQAGVVDRRAVVVDLSVSAAARWSVRWVVSGAAPPARSALATRRR